MLMLFKTVTHFPVSPLTVANINTCETDSKQDDAATAPEQCSLSSLPLTGGFSLSHLCLPSCAFFSSPHPELALKTSLLSFRGAVLGAVQGDRSRRHTGRYATRVSSGSAKGHIDDSTIGEKLQRRRDQVRAEKCCGFDQGHCNH